MSSRLPWLLVLTLGACNAADRVAAPSTERFGRPDIIVHAGTSIQDAIDAAAPGAVIHIEPGTYAEALTVTRPGIKLIGLRDASGGVVIENPGDEDTASSSVAPRRGIATQGSTSGSRRTSWCGTASPSPT